MNHGQHFAKLDTKKKVTMSKWVVFGDYPWTMAVMELCVHKECGGVWDTKKLVRMLHENYRDYRWEAPKSNKS